MRSLGSFRPPTATEDPHGHHHLRYLSPNSFTLLVTQQYIRMSDRVGLEVTCITFCANHIGRRNGKNGVTCMTMGQMKRTIDMIFDRKTEGKRKLKTTKKLN